MNRYWIPNLDIHKRIITQELQYYLGPQATVRSYTLEVCSTPPPPPPDGAVLFGGFVANLLETPFSMPELEADPITGRGRLHNNDTRPLPNRRKPNPSPPPPSEESTDR